MSIEQKTPNWMIWTGWVLTVLPALLFVFSGVMKVTLPAEEGAVGLKHLGWDHGLMLGLGITEITCAVIYLIPRTSILGAILLTGYLGGAIATHVRVYDPFALQAGIGVVVWLGVYFRDDRLRGLIPWRT